ncbi:hypothetical protein B23_2060 [Geobacillus thermoleovorans B23]|nr:hypothetical protein B23_2060 [Geobacillus thermoleovorans B23]
MPSSGRRVCQHPAGLQRESGNTNASRFFYAGL